MAEIDYGDYIDLGEYMEHESARCRSESLLEGGVYIARFLLKLENDSLRAFKLYARLIEKSNARSNLSRATITFAFLDKDFLPYQNIDSEECLTKKFSDGFISGGFKIYERIDAGEKDCAVEGPEMIVQKGYLRDYFEERLPDFDLETSQPIRELV